MIDLPARLVDKVLSMKLTRFRDIPEFVRDGSWEANYPPDSLLEFIDECTEGRGGEQKLDVDPDFQRGHVWTTDQQVAWLEFFFRGGKTGRTIYLNNPGWQSSYTGDFVLVDGKQRIEALRAFFGNKIKIFGSYRREFTDKPSISQHTMKLNVNTLKTRKEVLQWYLGYNAGGVNHAPEEIARVYKLLEAEK